MFWCKRYCITWCSLHTNRYHSIFFYFSIANLSIQTRDFFFKVRTLWEGHTILKKYPTCYPTVTVNVKTNGQVLKIFVAFSKNLNFKRLAHSRVGKAKTFWKIESANAIFWMYLGGTAKKKFFLVIKFFCFSR